MTPGVLSGSPGLGPGFAADVNRLLDSETSGVEAADGESYYRVLQGGKKEPI